MQRMWARSCGLTPEVLADQKDVCGKVVTYFQTLYSNDPVVMRRIPLKKDWHPGSPLLNLNSWLRFKAAAVDRAKPTLSEKSASTTEVDRFLTSLSRLTGKDGNYAKHRDTLFPEVDLSDPNAEDKRVTKAYRTYLESTSQAATGVVAVLKAWKPVAGAPEGEDANAWIEGSAHDGMIDIAESLIAQAQLLTGEVAYDLRLLDERDAAIKMRNDLMLQAAQQLMDDSEKESEQEDGNNAKEDEDVEKINV